MTCDGEDINLSMEIDEWLEDYKGYTYNKSPLESRARNIMLKLKEAFDLE